MKYISFLFILFLTVVNCKKPQSVMLASGFVGGTYHSITQSLKNLPNWQVQVTPSNGSLDNVYLLMDGKVDMALVQLDLYRSALMGNEKLKVEIKPIIPVLQDEVHLVARKNIKSIQDLKGKKIVIGHSESGIKSTSLTILLEVGISGTDVKLIEESPSKGIPLLLKGEVDAVFVVSGMPVKILADIPESESKNIHILPLLEVFESKINKSNKVYALGEIPTGTYAWQKEKVETLLVQTVLYARKSFDSKLAKSFVEEILKNKLTLEVGHTEWKQFTMENLSIHLKKSPELFDEEIRKIFTK